MYFVVSSFFAGVLWDPSEPRFPVWVFTFISLGLSFLGAGVMRNYLRPGLLAYQRNHPRKEGIMWDTIRFGWLAFEREQLMNEAEFGSAPAYDHELPEKIAAAIGRGDGRDRDVR